MEKPVKCFLLLPLQEMALRRMVINFLSDSDILTANSKFRFRLHGFSTEEIMREWQESIENKIKQKMLKLDLPYSLTKRMIDLVRPITFEILRWKIFHQKYLDEGLFQSSEEISIPDSSKLCWTTAGRIDNKKTAAALVLCNGLALLDRYKLACLYCLEDRIPLLWKELPEEQKDYFCVDGKLAPHLHYCWPHLFKGEWSKLDHLSRRNLTSFNQWALEHSVIGGNKTAAEFFFNRLTEKEREASLRKATNVLLLLFVLKRVYNLAERCSDVLCYLLSVMTPEQQMEAIKKHPITVLLSFFHWPWQDLFIENAALIWTYLPSSCYDHLLRMMTDIFKTFYPKSFPEFFVHCPRPFKKYFVEPKFGSVPACRFLSIFFRSEDSASVEVIFRNVDVEDRLRLVFHPDVLELFHKSILRDRWSLVEVCLREAKLSEADRKRLKEDFTGFLERSGNGEFLNRKFKNFFEFLDKTDASADEERKAQIHKLENYCI